MAGIFLSTETHFGTQGGVGGRNRSSLINLPDSLVDTQAYSPRDPAELKQLRERLTSLQAEQRKLLEERLRERANGGSGGNPGPEFLRVQQQVVSLETELSLYNEDGSMKALAMGVEDKPRSLDSANLAARQRGPGGRPLPGNFFRA